MRKLPLALCALIVLAATSGGALAASTPLSGTIQSVDPTKDMVMFQDGTRFHVGKDVDVAGLDPGTDVVFYYYWIDGQRTVVSYKFTE